MLTKQLASARKEASMSSRDESEKRFQMWVETAPLRHRRF